MPLFHPSPAVVSESIGEDSDDDKGFVLDITLFDIRSSSPPQTVEPLSVDNGLALGPPLNSGTGTFKQELPSRTDHCQTATMATRQELETEHLDAHDKALAELDAWLRSDAVERDD